MSALPTCRLSKVLGINTTTLCKCSANWATHSVLVRALIQSREKRTVKNWKLGQEMSILNGSFVLLCLFFTESLNKDSWKQVNPDWSRYVSGKKKETSKHLGDIYKLVIREYDMIKVSQCCEKNRQNQEQKDKCLGKCQPTHSAVRVDKPGLLANTSNFNFSHNLCYLQSTVLCQHCGGLEGGSTVWL